MELKNVKKANKFISKLKEIDKNIITLEKLAQHHKGGCFIELNFGEKKEEEKSSGLYFSLPTFLNSDESPEEDYKKTKEIDLSYSEKLIDTESLFLLDCMIKIKQQQRNWIFTELKKLKIKI